VHVGNGSFCIGFMHVENVCGTTVDSSQSAKRQIEILNLAILPKDLAEVVFIHILGETLDNDLGASRKWAGRAHAAGSTTSAAIASTARVAAGAAAATLAATLAAIPAVSLGRPPTRSAVIATVN
jgi:hypothetical protein